MKRRFLLSLLFASILISASDRLEEGMMVPRFFVRIHNEEKSGYSIIKSQDLFNGRNKAVVISFFASYCKPCKKEIFVLDEFYKQYRDKGVMIIEISIDTEKEGIELFKEIVKSKNISMPCVIDNMGLISRRFGVDKLPTLFVFDKYGYVKKRFEGYTEENVNNFEKVVLQLIEDRPPDKEPVVVPDAEIMPIDGKIHPEEKNNSK